MTIDRQSLSPIASNWFSTRVEYSGWGVAEFADPAGRVEGPVRASFDEHGEARIKMEIERHESTEKLDFGLWQLLVGGRPTEEHGQKTFRFGGQHNTCTRLVVTSPEGAFSADEDIFFGYALGDVATIDFFPLRSQFEAATPAEPCYWVMPLSNFVSAFAQSHPQLDRHPLRIYQTPTVSDELSGTDLFNAQLVANHRNRLIIFEFGSALGFIEPLADYGDREASLKAGRERNLITAIMVGAANGPSSTYDEISNWLPLGFIRLLGFVTGIEVGSPWVELRDAQGTLVRRIHYKLGHPCFEKGHTALDENIHRATGELLTRAQSSPYWSSSVLGVVLKSVTRGGLSSLIIEDKSDYLLRALDALCEYFDLSRLNLMTELKPEHQEAVRNAINGAVRGVTSLARTVSIEDEFAQQRSLQKIAGRLSNAANQDVDFGLSVCKLLQRFGLPDPDIIDAHYRAHPRSDGIPTWSAVLSRYRGIVIHEGYFEVLAGRDDLDNILTLMFHLHDILVRLIFKMLGYAGPYQPTMIKMTTDMPVDWVTTNVPASRLGYS